MNIIMSNEYLDMRSDMKTFTDTEMCIKYGHKWLDTMLKFIIMKAI